MLTQDGNANKGLCTVAVWLSKDVGRRGFYDTGLAHYLTVGFSKGFCSEPGLSLETFCCFFCKTVVLFQYVSNIYVYIIYLKTKDFNTHIENF